MRTSIRLMAAVTALTFFGGCARDLSSNSYTSDSTLNLTLEGEIVSVRPIIITDSDQLTRNTAGIISGGAVGGVAASGVGNGSGRALAVVGGVIVGAALGALVESELGKQDGYEYIVKLDTSKLKGDYFEGTGAMRNAISAATTNGLATIVQGNETSLQKGQKVYAIFSDKRTRLIAQ
ncbi:MAG: hypothetical protein V4735_02060 [Pseudomonadota bacterium]